MPLMFYRNIVRHFLSSRVRMNYFLDRLSWKLGKKCCCSLLTAISNATLADTVQSCLQTLPQH